jgi:UDP-glucose 4-epimerase
MKRNDVSRLVFSSTAAVYGEPDEIPIREAAPTLPTNPYGASKLAVDHLIGYAAAADGATAASLRYFNVAGAYGRYGEIHDPETHVIPVLLDVASGRRDGFKVFGTDYETDDGTAVRDYVHVEDLARAHLFALERAAPGSHSIYNLGNGRGFSVNEVLEAARSVTKRAIPAEEVGRRAGDPPVLVASSAKAESELGWKRVKPSLEEMIEDAWRFHRSSLA